MGASWRTTAAGILAGVGALTKIVLALLAGQAPDGTDLALVAAAVGLLMARDDKVSSERTGAK